MPDPKDIDKAINEKFISKEKFAEEIEAMVLKTKMNYIDAIVEYCTENEIELESVGKLVSKPLKEKIKCEAMELNYLKQTSKGKLPI
tara:strand:- start:34528 stop:34788 length:261 start_codon:yes stop_codon:yes gene_type:complete